jgi:hypothetical protein
MQSVIKYKEWAMKQIAKYKYIVTGIILTVIFCALFLRIYVPVVEGNIGSGWVRSYETLDDQFANSLKNVFNKYEVFYIRVGNIFIISSFSYYDEELMATCTMVANREKSWPYHKKSRE